MEGKGSAIDVLYVDDDPAVAELTAEQLAAQRAAFSVQAVESAAAGLAYLDREDVRVDCVVSDYRMPEVDGLEFLERVRERDPDLPFVLFTARGSEGVAADAIAAGVTDYLPRGSDPDEVALLANRIEHAVAERRAEAELAEKSSLLDSLFEQVPVHLFVKDREARHVRVSSGFVDDPERFVGKRDSELDIVSDEHGRAALADDRRVIEDGERIVDQEEYLPNLAQWNLTSKVPWRDEDGEVVGLIGVSWDITERKRREQEARRQAERIDRFAGVVSHDLRNPLSLATALAEELDDRTEGETADLVADLRESLTRMDDLIEDVLTLAREGEQVVETEAVPLQSVAYGAWSTVTAGDEVATLAFDDPGAVVGDATRVRRLLENLFRNAVQHNDAALGPGGDGLTVTVGHCPGGFYVADDGRGIPAEERDDVLEAGYSTAPDGTGFGLSIVAEIADAHGWDLALTESAAGGARFEFTGVERPDDRTTTADGATAGSGSGAAEEAAADPDQDGDVDPDQKGAADPDTGPVADAGGADGGRPESSDPDADD